MVIPRFTQSNRGVFDGQEIPVRSDWSSDSESRASDVAIKHCEEGFSVEYRMWLTPSSLLPTCSGFDL